MIIKKKGFRVFRSLAVILAIIILTGSEGIAVDSKTIPEDETNEISLKDYIEGLELVIDENSEISLGIVELESKDITTKERTSEEDIPAVIVTTENEDETITSSAYIDLAVDEDNNLVSGLIPDSASKDNSGDVQKVFSKAGFSIKMEATYYKVNMTDYGSSGYAYAPSYSYYTITRGSASGTITDCTFYTLLHGTYSVKNTDPTTRVQVFPQYMHTYYAGTPILSYKYSFNDYSLYSNSSYDYGGFSGQLIHIPNGGQGSYSLKTEFTYGGTEYTLRYGIYNIGNLN